MICKELKIVHISICRNASTSISKAFKNRFPRYHFIDKHHSVSDVGEIMPEQILKTYKSFAVVRNPFDRIVSIWLWGYQTMNNITFKDFLRNVSNRYYERLPRKRSRITGLSSSWFRTPQIKWITDATGKIRVNRILRFENLDDNLNQLCKDWDLPTLTLQKLNIAKKRCGFERKHWTNYYDDEDLDTVRKLFKEDFEAFNYKKHRVNRTTSKAKVQNSKLNLITTGVAPTIETPLCKLAYKYGTDKCPQIKHSYTPYYYQLLKSRRSSIKKVLELGIGYYNNMQDDNFIYNPSRKLHYHKGASLKMWRDFFPNAQVFGVDNNPETMFEDKRIKTYLFDERKKEDLIKLIKNTGSDIDLLVDDASHHVDDQIFACQTLMPLLNKDVTYIIEDVGHSRDIIRALKSYTYDIEIPNIPRRMRADMLMVIRKKS